VRVMMFPRYFYADFWTLPQLDLANPFRMNT
jgi:hypothetical protein